MRSRGAMGLGVRSRDASSTASSPVYEFSALSGVAEGGKHLVLSWGAAVCGWGRVALRRTLPGRDPALGAGPKGDVDRPVPGSSSPPPRARLRGPSGAAPPPARPTHRCYCAAAEGHECGADAQSSGAEAPRLPRSSGGASRCRRSPGAVTGRRARCPPNGAGHRREGRADPFRTPSLLGRRSQAACVSGEMACVVF